VPPPMGSEAGGADAAGGRDDLEDRVNQRRPAGAPPIRSWTIKCAPAHGVRDAIWWLSRERRLAPWRVSLCTPFPWQVEER
jgi:hypothetical protein